MANVEGMVCIWLGVFDHDALSFWRAPPKVRAGGEHFIHHPTLVLRGRKVEIAIALHCFHATDAGHSPDLCLDLLVNLLSALRHRDFVTPAGARFISRSLEERGTGAPFTIERNRLPFKLSELNI